MWDYNYYVKKINRLSHIGAANKRSISLSDNRSFFADVCARNSFAGRIAGCHGKLNTGFWDFFSLTFLENETDNGSVFDDAQTRAFPGSKFILNFFIDGRNLYNSQAFTSDNGYKFLYKSLLNTRKYFLANRNLIKDSFAPHTNLFPHNRTTEWIQEKSFNENYRNLDSIRYFSLSAKTLLLEKTRKLEQSEPSYTGFAEFLMSGNSNGLTNNFTRYATDYSITNLNHIQMPYDRSSIDGIPLKSNASNMAIKIPVGKNEVDNISGLVKAEQNTPEPPSPGTQAKSVIYDGGSRDVYKQYETDLTDNKTSVAFQHDYTNQMFINLYKQIYVNKFKRQLAVDKYGIFGITEGNGTVYQVIAGSPITQDISKYNDANQYITSEYGVHNIIFDLINKAAHYKSNYNAVSYTLKHELNVAKKTSSVEYHKTPVWIKNPASKAGMEYGELYSESLNKLNSYSWQEKYYNYPVRMEYHNVLKSDHEFMMPEREAVLSNSHGFLNLIKSVNKIITKSVFDVLRDRKAIQADVDGLKHGNASMSYRHPDTGVFNSSYNAGVGLNYPKAINAIQERYHVKPARGSNSAYAGGYQGAVVYGMDINPVTYRLKTSGMDSDRQNNQAAGRDIPSAESLNKTGNDRYIASADSMNKAVTGGHMVHTDSMNKSITNSAHIVSTESMNKTVTSVHMTPTDSVNKAVTDGNIVSIDNLNKAVTSVHLSPTDSVNKAVTGGYITSTDRINNSVERVKRSAEIGQDSIDNENYREDGMEPYDLPKRNTDEGYTGPVINVSPDLQFEKTGNSLFIYPGKVLRTGNAVLAYGGLAGAGLPYTINFDILMANEKMDRYARNIIWPYSLYNTVFNPMNVLQNTGYLLNSAAEYDTGIFNMLQHVTGGHNGYDYNSPYFHNQVNHIAGNKGAGNVIPEIWKLYNNALSLTSRYTGYSTYPSATNRPVSKTYTTGIFNIHQNVIGDNNSYGYNSQHYYSKANHIAGNIMPVIRNSYQYHKATENPRASIAAISSVHSGNLGETISAAYTSPVYAYYKMQTSKVSDGLVITGIKSNGTGINNMSINNSVINYIGLPVDKLPGFLHIKAGQKKRIYPGAVAILRSIIQNAQAKFPFRASFNTQLKTAENKQNANVYNNINENDFKFLNKGITISGNEQYIDTGSQRLGHVGSRGAIPVTERLIHSQNIMNALYTLNTFNNNSNAVSNLNSENNANKAMLVSYTNNINTFGFTGVYPNAKPGAGNNRTSPYFGRPAETVLLNKPERFKADKTVEISNPPPMEKHETVVNTVVKQQSTENISSRQDKDKNLEAVFENMMSSNINRFVDKIYSQFERRLKLEKVRRGV
jgi:hypothetical protein